MHINTVASVWSTAKGNFINYFPALERGDRRATSVIQCMNPLIEIISWGKKISAIGTFRTLTFEVT